MKKQEQVNDHIDVSEFIEELMEEERAGIKKGGYNIKDDIPINIENKERNQEIESRKKAYQEQKLELIKDEEEFKAELARITKEKIERNKRLR
jgi:carbonic anhydrase